MAAMPKGLDHLGVAVIGNTIVTVGGFIGSVHRGAVSDVYQYDVAANAWRALAPLKAGRGSVAVAVLDGKIHAVGGRGVDNTFTVGTHEVFDPATGQWTERAPLPQPRDHMALVAIDGKLHAIGGRITNPAKPHRPARHLRSEDRLLVVRPAAADRAQRTGLCEPPGHGRGAGRRAAARHVPGKRGLRSEIDALADAHGDARRAVTAPARRCSARAFISPRARSSRVPAG